MPALTPASEGTESLSALSDGSEVLTASSDAAETLSVASEDTSYALFPGFYPGSTAYPGDLLSHVRVLPFTEGSETLTPSSED